MVIVAVVEEKDWRFEYLFIYFCCGLVVVAVEKRLEIWFFFFLL